MFKKIDIYKSESLENLLVDLSKNNYRINDYKQLSFMMVLGAAGLIYDLVTKDKINPSSIFVLTLILGGLITFFIKTAKNYKKNTISYNFIKSEIEEKIKEIPNQIKIIDLINHFIDNEMIEKKKLNLLRNKELLLYSFQEKSFYLSYKLLLQCLSLIGTVSLTSFIYEKNIKEVENDIEPEKIKLGKNKYLDLI